MTSESPASTSADVISALRLRYERPEFQLETELTLNGRRLDAVAMSIFASGGYRLIGFEIKVSRADFLRELNDHRKSSDWFSVVDTFFFVAPPGVVKPEELPTGCGLLEFRNPKLRLKTHATNRKPSPDLPREVVARFIGRASTRELHHEHMLAHELRTKIRAELLEEQKAKGDPNATKLSDTLGRLSILEKEQQQFESPTRFNKEHLAMGLDMSHGCWSGPYSAFRRWRAKINLFVMRDRGEFDESCKAIADLGLTNGALERACAEGMYEDQSVPINVLMNHPDSEGIIESSDCGPLADALQALVDKHMPPRALYDEGRPAFDRFVAGLRMAAAAGEDVLFH